jgi:hypothetical protein
MAVKSFMPTAPNVNLNFTKWLFQFGGWCYKNLLPLYILTFPWQNLINCYSWLSICDICVKQKILVINETKQDEILLKPKVLDQEKLCSIPLNSLTKFAQTFVHFQWHKQKLSKISQY